MESQVTIFGPQNISGGSHDNNWHEWGLLLKCKKKKKIHNWKKNTEKMAPYTLSGIINHSLQKPAKILRFYYANAFSLALATVES